MNKNFFFQTREVSDDSIIFDQFKKQKIYFSYFLVDQKYYFFLYAQKYIDIDFLYRSVDVIVIQELNSKRRKIRSLRGFFLYALEIMEVGKDVEILKTNLQPFFWRKVKNILRQKKKPALIKFLFGFKNDLIGSATDLEKELESLKGKIEKLQERVNNLEDINILSETSKITLKQIDTTQQYDSSLIGNKRPTGSNFVTLGKISEEDKIEIIELGFQLKQEGQISLKKYYESTGQDSLFSSKRYNIKYETIRRTKLYKNLKD